MAYNLGIAEKASAEELKFVKDFPVATSWTKDGGYIYDSANSLRVSQIVGSDSGFRYEPVANQQLCNPSEATMSSPVCSIIAFFVQAESLEPQIVEDIYKSIFVVSEEADLICGINSAACVQIRNDSSNISQDDVFIVLEEENISTDIVFHELAHWIGSYGGADSNVTHEIIKGSDETSCLYLNGNDAAYYCTGDDSGSSCELVKYPELIATELARDFIAENVNPPCADEEVFENRLFCGGYPNSMIDGEDRPRVLPRSEVKSYRQTLFEYFEENREELQEYSTLKTK